jgi:hypothetical protein
MAFLRAQLLCGLKKMTSPQLIAPPSAASNPGAFRCIKNPASGMKKAASERVKEKGALPR